LVASARPPGSQRPLFCGSGTQGVSLMGIVLNLSALALKHVVDRACKAMDLAVAAAGVDRVVGLLTNRFAGQSQRPSLALQKANDSAWKPLEIALAGESFWNCLDRPDTKALRRQIREFLDATPLDLPDEPVGARTAKELRRDCLGELRAARKA